MTLSPITWLKEDPKQISLKRQTRESLISINIEDAPRRDFKLNTGICFFNHMLETIAWRACLNIDARYENTQFRLTHVISEDTGITLGMAFAKMIELRMTQGLNGAGTGMLGIDEALAIANISFEGRSVCTLDLTKSPGTSIVQVEDALSADLAEFFRGFAQGARASIYIKTLNGDDPHHSWESVYRSFGLALKDTLTFNPWRAGTTAGVKGTLL